MLDACILNFRNKKKLTSHKVGTSQEVGTNQEI
jgi:hypothetical protein